MAETTGASGTGTTEVGEPAAVAGALRSLDAHARNIVQLALAQHAIRNVEPAAGVAEWHDRISRLLHAISLEHGSDAMSTAADYALSAMQAGLLYPGDELEGFLRDVAAAARTTARELAKGTPFGT